MAPPRVFDDLKDKDWRVRLNATLSALLGSRWEVEWSLRFRHVGRGSQGVESDKETQIPRNVVTT